MKAMKCWGAAIAMVALAGAAQAALVNRGGGMIYDSTRNITWLADMNYALTSGHAGPGVDTTNGSMTRAAAIAWADNLVYGGFSDWRLPTLNSADDTCSDVWDVGGGLPPQHLGTGCTRGELSGLFVTDLGNKAGESVLNQAGDTTEQIANLALFSNVQSEVYWSGTTYAPNPNFTWAFLTDFGVQLFSDGRDTRYAVAVRSGDVAVTDPPASVPEPQSLALALMALGAAVSARKRRPG